MPKGIRSSCLTAAYRLRLSAITTGPKLSFDEVPGAGPEGRHPFDLHHRPRGADVGRLSEIPRRSRSSHHRCDARRIVLRAGVRVRIHFQQGPQRRKLRNKVPLTFVTAEPRRATWAWAAWGTQKSMLESDFRNNDIKWIANARVTKVEDGRCSSPNWTTPVR